MACIELGVSNTHQSAFAGLPFQLEVNTGFGILAKTYIDATIAFFGSSISAEAANSPEAASAKEQALAIVEETFVNVKNPKAEVERGFRFWDSVSRLASPREIRR